MPSHNLQSLFWLNGLTKCLPRVRPYTKVKKSKIKEIKLKILHLPLKKSCCSWMLVVFCIHLVLFESKITLGITIEKKFENCTLFSKKSWVMYDEKLITTQVKSMNNHQSKVGYSLKYK